MSTENDFGLSSEEQSYFENRGASPQPQRPQPAPAPEPDEDEEQEFEADVEADVPQQQQQQRPRRSMLDELRGERKKRQEYEAELRQLREQQARIDERLRLWQEQQQRPAQPEPQPIPEPEDDPFAAHRALRGEVEKLKQLAAGYQQQTEEERLAHQIIRQAATSEAQFRKENPDYDEAVEFFKASKRAELTALGVPLHMHDQVIAQDALKLAHYALQNGQNPSALAFQFAKARGWQPKPKAEEQEGGPSEQIERIANVVAKSKSLSQVGGSASGRKLDAKTLANMDSDEFAALMSKDPKLFKRIMTGG